MRSLLPVISSWQRRTRARLGFYTEASMDLADDPELVDAMVDAGFSAVFLGIETPNPDALRETGKRQNLKGDPVSRIHALLSRGLDVWGGFILGFDSDGPDIFDRMIEFVRRASIPYAMVGLLGAPPGTALWKRLKGEGRLRTGAAFEGGDQFGLTNVINRLPPEQLLEGYHRVMDALYAPASYFQRCRDNLAHWSGSRAGARSVSLADLRAGLRAMIAQGVRGAYRREYWRFLGWATAHHPRKLATAIRQAAAGHHYITYTRETVLPALERTRAELMAAAAAATAARRCAGPSPGAGLAAGQHRVVPLPRVVRGRVVERVVQAARLLAVRRALDDQRGDQREVAQLDQVRRDLVVPVVLVDLALEVLDPGRRALQPLVAADDADVVPHQAADLVPVVVDDDQLVGIGRVAALPRRQPRDGPAERLELLRREQRRAVRDDDRLQERVAGQPVRAVDPGLGDLARGEQAGDRRLAVHRGDDAAALVVGGRHDRHRLLRHVEAELQALLVDVREPGADELRRRDG